MTRLRQHARGQEGTQRRRSSEAPRTFDSEFCVAVMRPRNRHLSDASRMAEWSIIGDALSRIRRVHFAGGAARCGAFRL
jgi:hypothetical protein